MTATVAIPRIVLFKASLPFSKRGAGLRVLDVEELADCIQVVVLRMCPVT
jgi:hypothetical protein